MNLLCVIVLLAFSGVAIGSMKSKEYAEKQPNIIYILSDDLGHSDVGFTNGFVETPNLNRLAKEGKCQNSNTHHRYTFQSYFHIALGSGSAKF